MPLGGIDGAFVLSINDTPEARDWFGDYLCEELRLKNTVSKGESCDAADLIVSSGQARGDLFGYLKWLS